MTCWSSKGANGDEMIPFVRDIVTAVDVDAKRIVADWRSSWTQQA